MVLILSKVDVKFLLSLTFFKLIYPLLPIFSQILSEVDVKFPFRLTLIVFVLKYLLFPILSQILRKDVVVKFLHLLLSSTLICFYYLALSKKPWVACNDLEQITTVIKVALFSKYQYIILKGTFFQIINWRNEYHWPFTVLQLQNSNFQNDSKLFKHIIHWRNYVIPYFCTGHYFDTFFPSAPVMSWYFIFLNSLFVLLLLVSFAFFVPFLLFFSFSVFIF